VPVIAALEFDDEVLFVAPRASRTALIVASVPLETNRIFSINGIARVISVASSNSSSSSRRNLCRAASARQSPRRWQDLHVQDHRAPGAHVVQQFVPSRRRGILRSALDNQRLAATDRNARTGLFTPPTNTFSARSENSRANACARVSPGLRCTHDF